VVRHRPVTVLFCGRRSEALPQRSLQKAVAIPVMSTGPHRLDLSAAEPSQSYTIWMAALSSTNLGLAPWLADESRRSMFRARARNAVASFVRSSLIVISSYGEVPTKLDGLEARNSAGTMGCRAVQDHTFVYQRRAARLSVVRRIWPYPVAAIAIHVAIRVAIRVTIRVAIRVVIRITTQITFVVIQVTVSRSETVEYAKERERTCTCRRTRSVCGTKWTKRMSIS
jgi:hypothetical protein